MIVASNKVKYFLYFLPSFLFIAWLFFSFFVVDRYLSPIDEYHVFKMRSDGFDFFSFIFPDSGRFFPLNGWFPNLISYYVSEVKYLFINNLLLACVLVYLIYKITKLKNFHALDNSNNSIIVFLLVTALFISPGIAAAFSRLFVPEKELIVLMSLLVILTNKYNNRYSENIFLVCVVSASLLFKESFVIIVLFSSIFFFIFGKNEYSFYRVYAYILMLLGITWVTLYFSILNVNQSSSYIDLNFSGLLYRSLLNFFKYSIADPFAMYGTLILGAVNLRRILVAKKFSSISILQISTIPFLFFYLSIDRFNYYYLLPIYPIILASAFDNAYIFNRNLALRKYFYIAIFAVYSLVFPIFTYLNLYYFNIQLSNEILLNKILVTEIASTICLEGVGDNSEAVHSLQVFLKARNSNNKIVSGPCGIEQDFIVIPPNSAVQPDTLTKLRKYYNEFLASDMRLAIPNYSLFGIVRDYTKTGALISENSLPYFKVFSKEK